MMESLALSSLAYSMIHSLLATSQSSIVARNLVPLFLISFAHPSLALDPRQFVNSLISWFVGMLRLVPSSLSKGGFIVYAGVLFVDGCHLSCWVVL